LDIVDAQLHVGRGKIGATLEAMDALGIRSVLIDEFWGSWKGTHPAHIEPGFLLKNGAWRAAWPTAAEASILHPERFSYLVRIDRLDPQLEPLMRTLGSTPGVRALRLQPVWTLEEAQAFAAGAYAALLDVAQDIGLPVCFFIPGHVELLIPYLKQYPRLNFIIDHCGVGYHGIPQGRPEPAAGLSVAPAYFAKVLELAEFPNVSLKWSHAQDRFGVTEYPFTALRPYLRRAIASFGADRIMWASDKSVLPAYGWSDLLHYLRDDPELSADEKTWILGGTARRILNWPADSGEHHGRI